MIQTNTKKMYVSWQHLFHLFSVITFNTTHHGVQRQRIISGFCFQGFVFKEMIALGAAWYGYIETSKQTSCCYNGEDRSWLHLEKIDINLQVQTYIRHPNSLFRAKHSKNENDCLEEVFQHLWELWPNDWNIVEWRKKYISASIRVPTPTAACCIYGMHLENERRI